MKNKDEVLNNIKSFIKTCKDIESNLEDLKTLKKKIDGKTPHLESTFHYIEDSCEILNGADFENYFGEIEYVISNIKMEIERYVLFVD